MKTAISIPDTLFAEAEEFANNKGISRSQLYQMAMSEFLRRHEESQVTQQLNNLYAETDSTLDESLYLLQESSLEDDW
ncbi:MAG: ChpI protein [Lentisphaeria bacterium]|nr:ChpI protein [Lentisphaeria bacterium]NQZ71071.1 ChpI protein [Lentisphaeria bacterium]